MFCAMIVFALLWISDHYDLTYCFYSGVYSQPEQPIVQEKSIKLNNTDYP